MTAGRSRCATALALFLAGSLTAAAADAGRAKVRPWEREEPCRWWLGGEDGRSMRASIGQGESGIVLTLAHRAFAAWSDSERYRVELLFSGDRARRVAGDGWTTHDINGQGSLSVELRREQLPALAGATRVELRRNGKPVMTVPLSESPVLDELTACIRVPSAYSDSR